MALTVGEKWFLKKETEIKILLLPQLELRVLDPHARQLVHFDERSLDGLLEDGASLQTPISFVFPIF